MMIKLSRKAYYVLLTISLIVLGVQVYIIIDKLASNMEVGSYSYLVATGLAFSSLGFILQLNRKNNNVDNN